MRHYVEEVRLKSGAQGLLINVPGASVMSTRVHFRGGLRYCKKPELYEIAHVVEHLSFGANSKFRSESDYESEFTKNGAYHNAWTSDLSICYETECADFEWDRILNLKRLAICEPRFNDVELKSDFSTAGINQTHHRIIAEITISYKFFIPGKWQGSKVVADIVVAETVIMGTVPDSYTYLGSSDEVHQDYAVIK